MSDTKERCALVIEDSSMMRQLLGLALRRLPGLRLLEASNGAEGLEALDQGEVDIIVLDLNMPVMSGFVFLERLAQRPAPRPPVVVITTEGGQAEIDRAFALGATAYITKPVQATNVLDVVGRVLSENAD